VKKLLVLVLVLVASCTSTDGSSSSIAGVPSSSGSPSKIEGGGFTVELPEGFAGGTTTSEIHSALEAAFSPDAADAIIDQLKRARMALFAAGPLDDQCTVLCTSFEGSGSLSAIVVGYSAKLRAQKVRPIDIQQVRIDGGGAALMSYFDPASGVRTDAYAVPDGGGWILEYSARRSSFEKYAEAYRLSAETFHVT
jgi:hypothetical protein